MQDLEEKHRTEIKVFNQKVKHLEYEHGNNCDRVKTDSQKVMKEERLYHTNEEKEMLQQKKEQKAAYLGDEGTNIGEIEQSEATLDGNYKDLKDALEH